MIMIEMVVMTVEMMIKKMMMEMVAMTTVENNDGDLMTVEMMEI
jgi:hypothetical protein